MSALPAVTIDDGDDGCQVRVLPPEVRERSTKIVEECQLFVSSKSHRILLLNPHISISHDPSQSTTPFASFLRHNHRKEVKEFQDIVTNIQSQMKRLAKNTERQKLKAIGRRVRLENNSEDEEELLHSKIKAKEHELQEFDHYIASLERAEGEQLAEIEKLENGRR